VNFDWDDLLAALAIVLVIEGIMPFLNPAGTRRLLEQLSTLGDRELRVSGFISMVLGVALLFFIRS
jgi:uncharacterized protein